MNICYNFGNVAFAIGCISYTIDAFKLSRRPFNLIGCLLIDSGYILYMYDYFSKYRLSGGRYSSLSLRAN